MKTKAEIRKYLGGGLGNLSDPNIPKAEVEVYLRSRDGETFYVPTLAERIVHLLSNKGYRLSVTQWPEGAGFDKPCYKLVIYRLDNELEVEVQAPGLAIFDLSSGKPERTIGKIVWEKDKMPLTPFQFPTDTAKPGITVVSLEEVLGLPPSSPPKPEDLFEIDEVKVGPEE